MLQECEDKIKEVLEEIQKTQASIEELHAEKAARQKEIEDAPKTLQHLQSEIKLKNLDVAALQEKQKSHQQKLSGGRHSSKEYSRAEKETETLKKQQAKLEDEILALIERQEALKKNMMASESDMAARTREEEQKVSEKTLLMEGLQKILDEREKEKADISAQIPAHALKQFRELFEVLDGTAAARLDGDACGACFMGLSTGLVDQVKAHDDICFCDSCGRILHWME